VDDADPGGGLGRHELDAREVPGAARRCKKPKQIRGHLGLEIGWTVGPALIVVAIAIPTIQAVFATQRPLSEDAIVVEVTGHRFWWEFHYPEQGVTTANELWLPADRPVSLRLGSVDVIHSFWVPMLGGSAT
jgi:cytochrome c oxidase subunit II